MSEKAMPRWEFNLHRFVGLATALLFCVFAVDRADPAPSRSVTILNPMVRAGQDLRIQYTVDRQRECPVKVYRTFIDHQGVRWELDDLALGSAGPIGRDTFIRALQVPEKIAPGPAKYRVVLVYQCNPLHAIWPIVNRLPDESFEIASR